MARDHDDLRGIGTRAVVVAADLGEDVEAGLESGSEAGGSANGVAVIEVIWFDAHAEEAREEASQGFGIVVDSLEQDGLIDGGDAGLQEAQDGVVGLVGEFVGMVEMGGDPDGFAAVF